MSKVKSIWYKYYDYILIMLVYGLLHLFMHTDYWDDLTQMSVLKEWNYNLFGYLSSFYQSWGSTIILIGTEAIMGALPNFIWKILDVIMIELIYHFFTCIIRLLSGIPSPQAAVRIWSVLFFLNFPYSIFATAGWLTTTIAYAWPFAMFFYSLYIILLSARQSGMKPITYILYFPAIFFASNYYLHSIVLFIIFIYIYKTCKSKNHCFHILFIEGMIGIISNILLFILSPGNWNRNIEDARYHGTYELLDMSIGGHLRMGINTTFYHFVSVPNIVLFTMCLLLLICTFRKVKLLTIRFLSCIPLLIYVFWTVYVFFKYTIPNRTLTYIYPDASFQICPKPEQYCALVSALLLVAVMCYLLAFLTDFSYLSWILVGILLVVGLLPEVILGFTTTVSASIMRVASYFYLASMFCSCMLVIIHSIMKNQFLRKIFYSLAGLGTFLNILQIVRHIIVYG